MKENILARILVLKTAPLPELQKEYEALFNGKKAPSNNKTYLWQKIAYRIQELEYGGLTDDARAKAKDLAKEYDPINNKVLRADDLKRSNTSRDKRLPIPGTIITKNYKGTEIRVKILDKGFEYNGKVHRTLTAIAKEVTGSHWNGYLFFSM